MAVDWPKIGKLIELYQKMDRLVAIEAITIEERNNHQIDIRNKIRVELGLPPLP